MPGPSPAEAHGDVRQERALAVVQGGDDLVISPQVVAEYYSVMLRNAQTDAWIQANLRAMFARTRLQPANGLTLSTALDLRHRFGFSFWDCQIAAAALHAGCGALLTEDTQHGQVLEKSLRVVNPLLAHVARSVAACRPSLLPGTARKTIRMGAGDSQ